MIRVICPHCGQENRISEEEENPVCERCQCFLEDDTEDVSEEDEYDIDEIPF